MARKTENLENLEKEISLLSKYLPEELSEDKILEIVHEVIDELHAESVKDMGKVMKVLTERIGSVADMSKVSTHVKEILN